MKKTNLLLVATISMIAFSTCLLNASTTNEVSQDIYVKQSAPDANQNSSDLSLSSSGNQSSEFYLRFNYATAFENLSDAAITLNLYNIYPDESFNITVTVYGLEDGSVGESFDETTMTWNNKPPYGTALFSSDLSITSALKGTIIPFQSEELADFMMASTNNIVSFAFVVTGGQTWKKCQFSPRTWVQMPKKPSLIAYEEETSMGTLVVVQ
jgi:hypothetical protein